MIPFVSSIIFPMTFLVFLIPNLIYVYEKFIYILEKLNLIFSTIDFLEFVFLKPCIIMVFIYFIIIIYSFYNKKILVLVLIFLVIHKFLPNLDRSYFITILDVGQGDSIFLKMPYNNGNILIDTGGVIDNKIKNKITNNKLIPYFYYLGITKLDYLILTHGDYDHMGEAINLVNNFKVEKVIFNCGEFNEFEQELIQVLDRKKIKYYSCIKELNIDKNKLYFLQIKEYDNENDNSNVIYTELNGYKFMFMGDASVTTEKEIINKYKLPDIDVLKVGHHGSRTSSDKNFINEINPKYSIISVGKNNRYGHLNKEVLENLKESKIYRTDEDGSIMFKIKNNKLNIVIYIL